MSFGNKFSFALIKKARHMERPNKPVEVFGRRRRGKKVTFGQKDGPEKSERRTQKKGPATRSLRKDPLDEILGQMEQEEKRRELVEKKVKEIQSRPKSDDPILSKILEEMGVLTQKTLRVESKPTEQKIAHEKNIKEGFYNYDEKMRQDVIDMYSEFLYQNSNAPRGIFYEFEVRFGNFLRQEGKQVFKPKDHSSFFVEKLVEKLEKLLRDGVFSAKYIEEEENLTTVSGLRRITNLKDDQDVRYESKARSDVVNSEIYGIRFSLSEEAETSKKNFDSEYSKLSSKKAEEASKVGKKRIIATRRIKDRTIYSGDKTDGPFSFCEVHITRVTQNVIFHDGSDGKQKTATEIELEFIPSSDSQKSPSELIESPILALMKLSQLVEDEKALITQKDLLSVTTKHNNLFGSDLRYRPSLFELYTGYWNKPKNIKLWDMIHEDFNPAVTVKYDGVRCSMFLTDNGIFLLLPPRDVYYIGKSNQDLSGTLIDCELLTNRKTNVVAAFDILFFKESDMRKSNFEKRIETLEFIKSQLGSKHFFENWNFVLKRFFTDGDFYSRVQKASESKQRDEIAQTFGEDGYIFQPIKLGYENNHTYKWKPPTKLTIDFLVKRGYQKDIDRAQRMGFDWPWLRGMKEREAYLLYVKDGKNKVLFTGTKKWKFPGITQLSKGRDYEDMIVEFAWKNEKFVPIRIRTDRTQPNNLTTAQSVWTDINEPIKESVLFGDSIALVRKFHNNIKLRLLRQWANDSTVLVDIGSGRGGDISKWSKTGVSKVLAIDPSSENLAEMRRRIKGTDMESKVFILEGEANDTGKVQKAINARLGGVENVNMMTSFWSLTFFPESEEKYRSLLKTINLLPEGGVFIGTTMEGERIRQLILNKRKTLPEQEKEFAIEFVPKHYESAPYSIEQLTELVEGDNDYIGDQILVDVREEGAIVSNQEEYLFYFREFTKDMAKMGFNLLFVKEMKDHEGYDKLSKLGQEFSSFNIAFGFVKGKKDHQEHPFLEEDQESKINDITNLSPPYYYMGGAEGPSSLVSSFLRATDKKYIKLPISNEKGMSRRDYANKIRKILAKKLTLPFFKTMKSSKARTDRVMKQEKFENYADAEEFAFIELQEKIEDTTQVLTEDDIVELMSDIWKTNVLILDSNLKVSTPFTSAFELVHNRTLIFFRDDYDKYDLITTIKGKRRSFMFRNDSMLYRTLLATLGSGEIIGGKEVEGTKQVSLNALRKVKELS